MISQGAINGRGKLWHGGSKINPVTFDHLFFLYMLLGDKVWRYINFKMAPGFPKKLYKVEPNLDAALYWPLNKKVFLFKVYIQNQACHLTLRNKELLLRELHRQAGVDLRVPTLSLHFHLFFLTYRALVIGSGMSWLELTSAATRNQSRSCSQACQTGCQLL